MSRLKILDLSNTDIEVLPNSISNLENLTALRLSSCYSLKYLPSLAKPKALKKLDLHQTGIEVAPQGVEMLICLEYLDLYCPLDELLVGILSNLSCLQSLVVDWLLKIKGEEVANLRKLETLRGHFYL
ncbi:hypothetical protein SLEP1_g22505 [Rubroshorea leprosula]|uniref:Uncharacterized protein n=1 Tax=Rubroshorea leprosula TaxID=152421 RepID=A0AAV5JKB4_9ROSI|nr:hypothetical protein SLEP1_g22505 [Rubroshorea leprosula]